MVFSENGHVGALAGVPIMQGGCFHVNLLFYDELAFISFKFYVLGVECHDIVRT
jgi:hypothetical protein